MSERQIEQPVRLEATRPRSRLPHEGSRWWTHHPTDEPGQQGRLPKGSIEFIRAGNGVWHTGEAEPGYVKLFQLWVALPPELENGPNASHYVMPDEVPGRIGEKLKAEGTLSRTSRSMRRAS